MQFLNRFTDSPRFLVRQMYWIPFFLIMGVVLAKAKPVDVNLSFAMQIPEGYQYITHDFNGTNKSYAYLIAKPNPDSKWDHDKYIDYQVILKNNRKISITNLWSSLTEIYVSHSGDGFFLINLMDGGWIIHDSGDFSDFTWYKPVFQRAGNTLYISYKSKYRTEIIVRELR